MSEKPFVHLHCHSHYSLLDGASPIKSLVRKAKGSGMNALALTDHGNLYGALEFYRAAKDAEINPVLGIEAYVAPHSRHQKEPGESSYHLTLLAQNRTGFRNLVKMSSKAFLEGFYRKPRIDRDLLAEHSEGVICLSGCVSGEFSRSILKGGNPDLNIEEAMDVARWFHSIFGDRYFIEIQNNNLEIQRLAMEGAVEVAKRLGLPLVATSDAHYVNQEDAEAQDILLCVNTGKFRTDTNRMRMDGNQFHLRTPEEMYAAFPGYEEALKQSQLIADSVDIDLELGKRHFPSFKVPDEKTPGDYLRELCINGLKERYAGNEEMCPGGELAPVVMERLDRELGVIMRLGFPNYFLIVWDFVRFAVENGIPCTARGSGVGSLVAYALKLSHVCPIKYDLLFERFLDVNRLEAPDIDIDFCKERRGEVIEYVKRKYGEANVAQIGTFGTLAARAAIRDVGRALGMPISRVDAVVGMVPDQLGISLDQALEKSEDLKKTYETDGEVRELLDLARKVEGLARNVGTHAAAVVIADRPLDEYVPLQRVQGKEEVITQWAMGDVEAAGLLKMDFLGLRNLTILSKAVDFIKQTTGQDIDPHDFPLDDKETFALLQRGETKGIFQLESGGIRDLLQRMKPDHFRDIIATNALYRPGPLEGGMVDDYIEVKHGRKEAVYPHPVMKEILEETNGVMVYQEQVMRILNRLGGIQLSSAYTCIKAISKKKLPIIAKFREEFLEGSQSQGLDKKKAEELFGMIEKFAGYGFNKSHSTAYAKIAYMTAYLKAHYPVEFAAALLTVERGDSDKVAQYVADARHMGVEVLPPDINLSRADFTPDGEVVRFGLYGIKNVGETAVDHVLAERQRGPFKDLFDFCARVDTTLVNKRAVEYLVKAGAFDHVAVGAAPGAALDRSAALRARATLLANLDLAVKWGAAKREQTVGGQLGLFGDAEMLPPTLQPAEDVSELEMLRHEKEALGIYLSAHPMASYPGLAEAATCPVAEVDAYYKQATAEGLPGRVRVALAGLVQNVVKRPTRKGTMMARFEIADETASREVVAFGRSYDEVAPLLEEDAPAVLVAEVSEDGEATRLVAERLVRWDKRGENGSAVPEVAVVSFELGDVAEHQLLELRSVLDELSGRTPVRLEVHAPDGKYLYQVEGAAVDASRLEELKTTCPWLSATLTVDKHALIAQRRNGLDRRSVADAPVEVPF